MTSVTNITSVVVGAGAGCPHSEHYSPSADGGQSGLVRPRENIWDPWPGVTRSEAVTGSGAVTLSQHWQGSAASIVRDKSDKLWQEVTHGDPASFLVTAIVSCDSLSLSEVWAEYWLFSSCVMDNFQDSLHYNSSGLIFWIFAEYFLSMFDVQLQSGNQVCTELFLSEQVWIIIRISFNLKTKQIHEFLPCYLTTSPLEQIMQYKFGNFICSKRNFYNLLTWC